MKLSRFAKLVKQRGSLQLCHVEGGGTWLGTNAALYRADGLPESVDADTILTILDFDDKTARKIEVHEFSVQNTQDICGLDLRDDTAPDIEAKKIPVAAVYNGVYATALLCDDEELVFYDEAQLAPLADVFRESDYVHTSVRADSAGRRYIVIRDGFDVIAGVMPLDIINKEFLGALQDFEARCVEQYTKNELRARYAATVTAEAGEESGGEQVTTDEMEGSDDED